MDGIINGEVLDNREKIKTYRLKMGSEDDLAKEVARIANLSLALGYKLQDENRLLTKDVAYVQIGHSAFLFKAILGHLGN